MIRKKLLKPVLLSLLTFLASTSAHATLVQYNFTANNGQVILLGNATLDPESVFGGLRNGDSLHGTISFDTEQASDFLLEDPDLSIAHYTGNISLNITLDRTGYSLGDNDTSAWLTDGHSTQPWSYVDKFIVGGQVALHLMDESGTALSGTGLPSALSLSSFLAEARVNFSYYSPTDYDWISFNADLTSLIRVGEVPEPATFSLMALGLGLLGVSVRRKKRPAA